MKKSFLFIIVLAFGLVGCENFLEEEYRSGVNSASITGSEQAFETLINSSYITLRAIWGKENIWDLRRRRYRPVHLGAGQSLARVLHL